MKAAPPNDAAAAFEARSAWWSAVAINIFVLFAAIDRLVSEKEAPALETTLRVVSMVFTSTVLTALFSTRKRPRPRLAEVAWILGVVPFLVMLPILGRRYDAIHLAWEPLFRQKLALLLVAALAPPRLAFGAAAAGLIASEVAVEYWGLGLRNSPSLWTGEPVRTFVYAALSFAILYRRARDLQLERELIRREQEALVVERLARVALAVHDMTNSPLQTLVASAAIIETDPLRASSVTGGMIRAVAKLKALNDALSAYQKQVVWRIGDESFDPRAVIASAGDGDASKRDPER